MPQRAELIELTVRKENAETEPIGECRKQNPKELIEREAMPERAELLEANEDTTIGS